eukprot:3849269-Pleurochrysis_carterae.AAC.2
MAYQSSVSAIKSAAPVTHTAMISSCNTSALGSKSDTETADQLGCARKSDELGKLSDIRLCTLYIVGISKKMAVTTLVDHSTSQKKDLRRKDSLRVLFFALEERPSSTSLCMCTLASALASVTVSCK